MYKRTLLLLTSLILLIGACSNDNTAAKRFRDQATATAATTESLSAPYFNQHHSKWSKRKFQIIDLKYDIRKTDSLVSPLVGTVSFTLSSVQTRLVPERDSAQASTEYGDNINFYKVDLMYALQDGQWIMTSGKYIIPDFPASSVQLTAEKIKSEPDSIPNAALIPWTKFN